MGIELAPPVLMPLWLAFLVVVLLLAVGAWVVRTLVVTRRDTALQVGDVPMAPDERSQWVRRVDAVQARWEGGELGLRALHLELARIVRGFASARSGRDLTTATVHALLDMADTAGPRSVLDRLARVRRAGRPLDTNPLGHVGELLAVWEQPSFARDPEAQGDRSLEDAREVVARW